MTAALRPSISPVPVTTPSAQVRRPGCLRCVGRLGQHADLGEGPHVEKKAQTFPDGELAEPVLAFDQLVATHPERIGLPLSRDRAPVRAWRPRRLRHRLRHRLMPVSPGRPLTLPRYRMRFDVSYGTPRAPAPPASRCASLAPGTLPRAVHALPPAAGRRPHLPGRCPHLEAAARAGGVSVLSVPGPIVGSVTTSSGVPEARSDAPREAPGDARSQRSDRQPAGPGPMIRLNRASTWCRGPRRTGPPAGGNRIRGRRSGDDGRVSGRRGDHRNWRGAYPPGRPQRDGRARQGIRHPGQSGPCHTAARRRADRDNRRPRGRRPAAGGGAPAVHRVRRRIRARRAQRAASTSASSGPRAREHNLAWPALPTTRHRGAGQADAHHRRSQRLQARHARRLLRRNHTAKPSGTRGRPCDDRRAARPPGPARTPRRAHARGATRFRSAASARRRRMRQLTAAIPRTPGVCMFTAADGQVLHVVRSSDMHARACGYFAAAETRREIREMISKTARIVPLRCATPLEAEVAEIRLIAVHRPPLGEERQLRGDGPIPRAPSGPTATAQRTAARRPSAWRPSARHAGDSARRRDSPAGNACARGAVAAARAVAARPRFAGGWDVAWIGHGMLEATAVLPPWCCQRRGEPTGMARGS